MEDTAKVDLIEAQLAKAVAELEQIQEALQLLAHRLSIVEWEVLGGPNPPENPPNLWGGAPGHALGLISVARGRAEIDPDPKTQQEEQSRWPAW